MPNMMPPGRGREALELALEHYDLNLPEEIVQRNMERLDEIMEDCLRCQACPGRENCESDGFVRVPRFPYGPDTVVVYHTPCLKDSAYRHAREVERILQSSGLPEELRSKSFENFTVTPGTKEAYMSARRVADDPNANGLLLAGPPGVGKSHLAQAITNARAASGRQVIFREVLDLLDDIKYVIRDDEARYELRKLIRRIELLVLDDLGAEYATEWARGMMLNIISNRLAENRQTVVTTNYETAAQLARRFGGGLEGTRIVSRLFGLCEPVRLSGPDWRLKTEG